MLTWAGEEGEDKVGNLEGVLFVYQASLFRSTRSRLVLDSGMDPLISSAARTLDRRALSRLGETRIDVLELDDASTADCDFGDGIACEAKCSAGDDIDACRKAGVIKLADPPIRVFPPSCIFTFTLLPPPSFVFPIIGGSADDSTSTLGFT